VRLRKRSHRERGASLPETAIIMSALLLVLCGIIDFGRAMYTYAFVAQIAREGARWAMVRGSQCTVLNDCPNVSSAQVQTYVQSLSEGPTAASQISATATWPPSECVPGSTGEAPGCVVQVVVTYPFKFMVIPFLLNTPAITFSSTSQMVVSQ
jgi:Flp pilus assembly protein TadG